MVHLEALGEQAVLRLDHVAIAIARKARMQAIARLGRLAVAEPVGHDDEVLGRIEGLPRGEELARKEHAAIRRLGEAGTAAAGAVPDQHHVRGPPGSVARDGAERAVVDAQFREHVAGGEPEVARHEVGFGEFRRIRCAGEMGHGAEGKRRGASKEGGKRGHGGNSIPMATRHWGIAEMHFG